MTTDSRTMGGWQLAEHIGINHQKLDRWVRAGYLEPKDPHPGTGRPREFDEHEIERAKWMAILVRDVGLDAAVASRVAGDIAEGQPAQIGRIILTPDLTKTTAVRTPEDRSVHDVELSIPGSTTAMAAAVAGIVRRRIQRGDSARSTLDSLPGFQPEADLPAIEGLAADCLRFLEKLWLAHHSAEAAERTGTTT